MSGQRYARLFRHRQHFIEKLFQPMPQHLVRHSWLHARLGVGVVDHVPRHPARHRRIARAIHADADSFTTSKRSFHATAHTRNAEVVANHGNADLAHAANDRFHILQVLPLLRTIEQNIVPMCWVEILDGLEFQPSRVNLVPQRL